MVFALLFILLADPVPTIPSAIEAVKKERVVQAESKKREDAARAELLKLLEAQNKELADLGLNGPKPPGPGPVVPPAPNNPLYVSLMAAYTADPAPTKKEALKELTELYKQAALMADNPAVRSTSELLTRVKQAATVLDLLKGESLLPMRKLIAVECGVLGEPSLEPMSEATRRQAVALFQRIHEALRGVGS